MKISDLNENTTSGSIATVAAPMNGVQSRTGIYPNSTKTGSMFKGKKTSKPFANSVKLSEGAIKDVADDLEHLDNGNFQKKYKASKEAIKAKFGLKETQLEEDDIILKPGQNINNKGFVSKYPYNLSNALADLYEIKSSCDLIEKYLKAMKLSGEPGLGSSSELDKFKSKLEIATRTMRDLKDHTKNAHPLDESSTSPTEFFVTMGSEQLGPIVGKLTKIGNEWKVRLTKSKSGEDQRWNTSYDSFYPIQTIIRMMNETTRKFGPVEGPFSSFKDAKDKVMGQFDKKVRTPNKFSNIRKKKISYVFNQITYDQFERLCNSSNDYEETEIDGKLVNVAYNGENCIGIWYTEAETGSACKNFEGDMMSFAEQDPNYPYLDEGAKVDRMVGHIKKSEEKAGKSKDTAEKIAWATANARGMLDNKNKKIRESDDITKEVKNFKNGDLVKLTSIKGNVYIGQFQHETDKSIVIKTSGTNGNPHNNKMSDTPENHILAILKTHIKSIIPSDLSEDELPPPENARKTQIAGTLPTYKKAATILKKSRVPGKTLDFGAGLGKGTSELGKDADSYEPFPRDDFKPHYIDVTKIPDNSYNKIVNLNVLNVVPNSGDNKIRDSIVKNIGRILAPGGIALITTRGKDVLTIKGTPGKEPMSMISKIGTYQKGFSTPELRQYIKNILGDGFEVLSLKLGPAGVMIKKLTDSNN